MDEERWVNKTDQSLSLAHSLLRLSYTGLQEAQRQETLAIRQGTP